MRDAISAADASATPLPNFKLLFIVLEHSFLWALAQVDIGPKIVLVDSLLRRTNMANYCLNIDQYGRLVRWVAGAVPAAWLA
jgi:hypothetical protein